MTELKQAVGRRGSLLGSMKAVAWAFFGIRGRGDHAADLEKLNPIHVVIAGIISAALFVTVLVLIVRWAVGSAG